MPEQNPGYVHEKVKGIDVVTLCDLWLATKLHPDHIEDNLCDLVDRGVERLILDFRHVEHFGSNYLRMVLRVRKKLVEKKPLQESRPPTLLTVCEDREQAMNLILSSETATLVLCSLSPAFRAVFRTLRLC